jgi:hypothetical protein
MNGRARNGRPPTITLEQYQRVREVRRLRNLAPSDKELARELGLPIKTIQNAMLGIKCYEKAPP